MLLRNALLLATVTAVLVGGSTVLHTPTFLYTPTLQQAPTFQHVPTFYQTPTVLHTPTYTGHPQEWRPLQVLLRDSSNILPCPGEGFYPHPTNCSRFYRCVDHFGTGQFFIRFMFECPTSHVFRAGISICVVGSCDVDPATTGPFRPTESSTDAPTEEAPTDAPTEAPVEPPTEAPTEEAPTDVPTEEAPTDAPTEAPVEPSTEAPTEEAPTDAPTEAPVEPSSEAPVVQSTTDSTLPPTTDVPEVTESDLPGSEVTEITPSTPATDTDSTGCTPKYVQHSTYCNVYVPCDNSSLRYACPTGSAFDQSRQMCRISASDETLCAGKAILHIPFLRTELVDGHILLTESLVLPPLDLTQPLHTLTDMTKTTSPLFPGAGFLRRPHVHLANTFTYPSRRRTPQDLKLHD